MDDLIVFDTDVLVDAAREIKEAVACLENAEQHGEQAISVVTQMELMVGCRNKKELVSLDKFLRRFHVLKLNEAIADKGVELIHRYRLSHGLLIADALIAATVLINEAGLVTKNKRHYRFVEDLHLLPYPELR
jgi:predicted nucleic acid-binding protein